MRDLAILEEWLVKVRQAKLNDTQTVLMQATCENDRIKAMCCAIVAENIRQIIEGIRLLDKDSGEFVKRHLNS